MTDQWDRWVEGLDVVQLLFPDWDYRARCLQLVEVSTKDIDTAATDGEHLFFNTEFSETLTQEEINFVVAHEVAHVVLGHLKRWPDELRTKARRARATPLHYQKWNAACDFAIHAHLVPYAALYPEYLQFPKVGLYDEAFADLSSEEIYPLLRDEDHNSLDVHFYFDESTGELVIVGPDGTFRVPPPVESEASTDRTAEPSALCKHPDWHSALSNWLQVEQGDDDSWTLLDRRYLAQNLIVPGREARTLTAVVAVDVSPSIPDEVYSHFAAVLESIREQLPDHCIELLWCDDSIRKHQQVHPGDVPDWDVKTGGCTDFRPVFRWIEDRGIRPFGVVYLTDGYGQAPEYPPDYPVLWAVWISVRNRKKSMSWGEHLWLNP